MRILLNHQLYRWVVGSKRFLLVFLIFIGVALFSSCSTNRHMVPHEVEKSAYEWYNEGLQYYIDHDYKKAEHCLLMVNEQHPGSVYSKLANLALGDVYFAKGDYILARDYYSRFIKLYPDSKESVYAQYMIALSYYRSRNGYKLDQTPVKKAIEAFVELLKGHPNNPYKEKIYFYLEKCAVELYRHELFVARFYYDLGEFKAADITLNYMEKHFKDVKFNDGMLYLLSAVDHYLKHEKLAKMYFEELEKRYPGSKYIGKLKVLLETRP